MANATIEPPKKPYQADDGVGDEGAVVETASEVEGKPAAGSDETQVESSAPADDMSIFDDVESSEFPDDGTQEEVATPITEEDSGTDAVEAREDLEPAPFDVATEAAKTDPYEKVKSVENRAPMYLSSLADFYHKQGMVRLSNLFTNLSVSLAADIKKDPTGQTVFDGYHVEFKPFLDGQRAKVAKKDSAEVRKQAYQLGFDTLTLIEADKKFSAALRKPVRQAKKILKKNLKKDNPERHNRMRKVQRNLILAGAAIGGVTFAAVTGGLGGFAATGVGLAGSAPAIAGGTGLFYALYKVGNAIVDRDIKTAIPIHASNWGGAGPARSALEDIIEFGAISVILAAITLAFPPALLVTGLPMVVSVTSTLTASLRFLWEGPQSLIHMMNPKGPNFKDFQEKFEANNVKAKATERAEPAQEQGKSKEEGSVPSNGFAKPEGVTTETSGGSEGVTPNAASPSPESTTVNGSPDPFSDVTDIRPDLKPGEDSTKQNLHDDTDILDHVYGQRTQKPQEQEQQAVPAPDTLEVEPVMPAERIVESKPSMREAMPPAEQHPADAFMLSAEADIAVSTDKDGLKLRFIDGDNVAELVYFSEDYPPHVEVSGSDEFKEQWADKRTEGSLLGLMTARNTEVTHKSAELSSRGEERICFSDSESGLSLTMGGTELGHTVELETENGLMYRCQVAGDEVQNQVISVNDNCTMRLAEIKPFNLKNIAKVR